MTLMDVPGSESSARSLSRVRLWYALLLVVFGVFAVRLFYLQIIKHDTYVKKAQSDQIREYEVDADRGTIYAMSGDNTVPLVVNQKLYTVYADPSVVKDPAEVAQKLAPIVGASANDLKDLLSTKDLRYVILKKKVSADVSKKVLALKLPGVGTQERNYRAYPQGTLASQLLGFVNDDGKGEYGLEQALNKELAGKNGQLKAVTDINGIPLAASNDNLLVQPVAGEDVTLTIDLGMQTQLEQILKTAQETYKSKKVGAIVMETSTGAVKAMANYPTFDPANYQNVDDASVFQNATVTEPIEPGSITKVLTSAAALNSGAITPSSSYYDPGSWTLDGYKITNIAEDGGPGNHNVADILNMSLNTGATWMLMQMGGSSNKITEKGRQTLYDYFSNHYRLGKETGIEQGYEGTGYMVGPEDKDNGINITYANMAFGQGYSASALQMVSALSAIVNGGTYYQPHLVASRTLADGSEKTVEPKVLVSNVISEGTSKEMRDLLAYVVKGHSSFAGMKFPDSYQVGGKTGTAEIAKSGGGYRDDLFNGTYMGFVGGDTAQYAIIVYNIEPHSYKGYAGTGAGQPVFANIAHMLIERYGVTPKTQ
jgi:cell division protein FtsI/penicillin-binding protein 2